MKTILLFFISIVFLGCSPEYYAPNSQNIPIMRSKGQTNLGLHYNEGEYIKGFELQAAHAITNHMALQLNTDWVKNTTNLSTNENSDELKASGNMLEIGAGYFNDIARNFTFETYGLICFGNLKYRPTTSANNEYFSAKFNRIGIQPSLSYSRKYFNTSLSSRIVHLKYNNINGYSNSSYFDTNYLKENNAYWLLEPALTIQAGFENFKFQLQYVHSFNLTNPSFAQETDIISIGIKLIIDPKKIALLNK